MFFFLLIALLIGAGILVYSSKERTTGRVGEITFVWLLVGYCGVATLVYGIVGLAAPEILEEAQGFPANAPVFSFVSMAMIAMSVASLLTVRYRGIYLIGPAVCWTIFFAGAMFIHLGDFSRRGGVTHGGVLAIFATRWPHRVAVSQRTPDERRATAPSVTD